MISIGLFDELPRTVYYLISGLHCIWVLLIIGFFVMIAIMSRKGSRNLFILNDRIARLEESLKK